MNSWGARFDENPFWSGESLWVGEMSPCEYGIGGYELRLRLWEGHGRTRGELNEEMLKPDHARGRTPLRGCIQADVGVQDSDFEVASAVWSEKK